MNIIGRPVEIMAWNREEQKFYVDYEAIVLGVGIDSNSDHETFSTFILLKNDGEIKNVYVQNCRLKDWGTNAKRKK